MTIEEAIHQNKFVSEEQKLMINIFYTSAHFAAIINKIVKPYGLSHQQYNVLRILRGQHPKPASINLITERMLDKMSNCSRLVDKLVLKEMATRSTCPNDRRQLDVQISDKGLSTLMVLDKQISALSSNFSNVNSADCKLANDILDRLRHV